VKHAIFDDLFVLEIANNHLGDVKRGLRIVQEHARVVRFNGVRASIKLQLRDVERFIHPAYHNRKDVRYIEKTVRTALNRSQYGQLAKAVRDSGCVLSATPFDEESVEFAANLKCEFLKLASSDVNDWPLIEAVAATRKPVIASTGGSSLKDVDDLVTYFANRGVPLALNHCVSVYPSEDWELDIAQVDFLKARYPDNVIGFSSHEKTDWRSSVMLAYAKGARTFERHVDLATCNTCGKQRCAEWNGPSPYCSTPGQVDVWFKAWKKAVEMCGRLDQYKRVPSLNETVYLDSLVRGAWAARDLPAGHVLRHGAMNDDVRLQIPLLRGQLSCRELMDGESLIRAVKEGEPLMIDSVDGPHAQCCRIAETIRNRGLEK
jgi:sialic acid synthase SpsE